MNQEGRAKEVREATLQHQIKKMYLRDMDSRKEIIQRSHERSRELGIKSSQIVPQEMLTSKDLEKRLSMNSVLVETAIPFIEELYGSLEKSGFIIVLTDSLGTILYVIGDETAVNEAAKLNMTVGASMHEKSVGTNAMGTALKIDQPLQITAKEHFISAYHCWTCSAAPIHNLKNEIIGSLNLTGNAKLVHPHTLSLVVAAVSAIENKMHYRDVNLQLAESQQFAWTMMNHISYGIIAIDMYNEIIWVNDYACGALNIRRTYLMNNPVNAILKDWGRMKNKLLTEGSLIDEESHFSVDKEDAKYLFNSFPIMLGKEREITGFLITFKGYSTAITLANKLVGSQAAYTFSDIVARSEKMAETIKNAKKVAKTNSTILITGESGVGKELLAQSIHNHSLCHDGPFMAINCGAISPSLIESELFGYEDGAFTGARKGGRPGKFEMAHKGTLFLDEIGEMPMDLQVKLLRTLQEGNVTRLGGEKAIKINVRIIAATNKELEKEIENGNFRLDLFYRLNVIRLHIPALRNRKKDILTLAKLFLRQKSMAMEKPIPELSKELEETLLSYNWPGNIRELENYIEKFVVFDQAPELNISDIEAETQQDNSDEIQSVISLQEAERQTIIHAKRFHEGNISRMAKTLGIGRNTLYQKMKKFNIEF